MMILSSLVYQSHCSLIILITITLLCSCNSETGSECDVTVNIDTTKSSNDCSFTDDTGDILTYECSSLQIAFEHIENEITSLNCTEILLLSGEHVITRNFTFTESIAIAPSDNAALGSIYVSFEIDTNIMESLAKFEPLYVWRFESVEYVSISGIHFASSPGIIIMNDVFDVQVTNCTFEYFPQGVIDVVNCPHLLIIDSIFQYNGNSSNVSKQYSHSIHSGAVSITADTFSSYQADPTIDIINCIFTSNTAMPSEELQLSTNDVLSRNTYTGRGGGLGMAIRAPGTIVLSVIKNCVFQYNEVQTWGGGAYIIFGEESNSTIILNGNRFIENESKYGAGGIFIVFHTGGNKERFSKCYVLNCAFIRNVAKKGGASVWPVSGAQVSIEAGIYNYGRYENCTFIENCADEYGAISLVTANVFSKQESHRPVEIVNCLFLNNRAKDTAAFSAIFVPMLFEGNNVFNGNRGGAIQIVGSIVRIKGTLEFRNTNVVGTHKAALTVSSFGQLILHRGTKMVFENNTGSVGAAIVAETLAISNVFAGLLYNPLCFLLYEDTRTPPNEWEEVEMIFSENSAVVGSVAFTYLLNQCAWNQLHEPFFNTTGVLRWNFIKFGTNTNTFHESEANDSRWFIQTAAQSINALNDTVMAYPGESFNLVINVMDELNNPVASVVRMSGPKREDEDHNDSHDVLQLEPGVEILSYKSQTIRTTALLHDNEIDVELLYQIKLQNILDFSTGINDTHWMLFKNCRPGHVLESLDSRNNFHKCSCDFNNTDIVTCDNGDVYFQNNVWGSHDSSSADGLFTYHCPVGYCRCIQTPLSNDVDCLHRYEDSSPDEQCTCDRMGILCGECKNNSGVSVLLNKCVSCDDGYSALIPLLIIIDIIIVIITVRYFISYKFPALLLPCIFYIQFLPYGTEAFENGFEFIRPFLYYISSAMSFYFPYDFCLYNNMSVLVSYLLRFIPAIVVSIVTFIMTIYCWHKVKLVCNRSWRILLILLLLVYPLTLHTSMSILNCPSVPVKGDKYEPRWYIDGSIKCFSGGHIPLSMVAILMILALVAFIPMTLVFSLKEFEDPVWFKRIQNALCFWFKDCYKWWYSVELFRRLILILMVVPFPGNEYPVFFTYCILALLFIYTQPYNVPAANWIEILLSVNTILLYTFHLSSKVFDINHKFSYSSGCHESVETFSVSSIILAFFYYLPMVVTVTVIIFLVGKKLHPKIKEYQKRRLSFKKQSTSRHSSEATEVRAKSVSELVETDGGSIHNKSIVTFNLTALEEETDRYNTTTTESTDVGSEGLNTFVSDVSENRDTM